MISTGESHLDAPSLKTAVCVVGTGPAGITLAWHLQQKGIDVVLCEGSRLFGRPPSASFPLDPNSANTPAHAVNENANLYATETAGLMKANEPEFGIRPSSGYTDPADNTYGSPWERERIYGGTSVHWGAQSRPLDPIVFEKRPGFGGWPITREDLDDHYAAASAFCGLSGDYYGPNGEPGWNFTPEYWVEQSDGRYFSPELDGWEVQMYQFWGDQQFQARKLDGTHTIDQSAAHVITNASLISMERTGESVTRLTMGVLGGTRERPTNAGTFEIEAQAVVLACGAVENARQLLLAGFGDDNDNVGAWFSAQPILGGYHEPAVTLSFDPWATHPGSPLVANNAIYQIAGVSVKGVFTPGADLARERSLGGAWFSNTGTNDYYHELLPCKDSRVGLGETVDVWGLRRANVDWQLAEGEEANFDHLVSAYTGALEATFPQKAPQVTPSSWANIRDTMTINGHHLCTARMSDGPETGVVDSNLLVFGTDNLFVAGSAVWATAGLANPTFSIIMFSIRLAEHLESRLGGTG